MNCPKCEGDSKVTDSRTAVMGDMIRRRRRCARCGYRWATVEIVDPGEEWFAHAITFANRTKAVRGHLAAAVRILDGKE